MEQKGFNSFMGKGEKERLIHFVQAVKDTEIEEHVQPAAWARVTADERRLIKNLCRENNPNLMIGPIFDPIAMSEEDRRNNKETADKTLKAS